ncbi:arginyl-tRNA synthetase [Streptomyces viridochromogenes]|uniref:arginine--tRNA ligase n=1 Tax=Streptomyces viridochromogenes TaxID=1938 RepID=A0A0J8C4S9_STRVR|nr:DALR anticodon-binding domain-containing protein [Streptomyces viridochromogenes]KMS72855.1 arginyl-tRNA synthetase [Streptomyces viridochromogenes]
MTPVELSRTVLRAVRRAVDEGELRVTVPERAVVTAPGPGGCGDYATNIALQLARPAGEPSLRVAEILRPHLADADGVADVVVTGPGFINISLLDTAPAALVEEILRRGTRYGFADGPHGDHTDHTPQGPQGSHGPRGTNGPHGPDRYLGPDPLYGQIRQLHCAHEIRAVVVMDAVARLLRSQGALVRTSCEARPEAEWEAVLGVRVDVHGTAESPAPLEVGVRPVPAPADPLPLGRDAARWALLYPAGHDRPRISDDHLVQREGNPLFRVRYAHARTRALSRNAADLGFDAEPGDVRHEVVALLADHPRVLAQAAAHRAPDRLARHLVTVADAVLALVPAVLPRGAEKPSATHRARLALAEAAGTVLAGGLSLLGIDAPDHL